MLTHQPLEARPGRWRLVVFLLFLPHALARAQTQEIGELSFDELRSLVGAQQQLLEQQRQQLEAQAATLSRVLDRLDQLEKAPGEPSRQGVAEATDGNEALQQPSAESEAGLNLSARQENVKVQDAFPGAIELPGTQIALRPSGFVGLNLVQSSSELGILDRFITASIPVGGGAGAGGGASVSARNSRLGIEARRTSDLGDFRAFIEGDFFGAGADGSDTFRLRHAFGQYRAGTIGQTWSTFVNPFSGPEEIDLEGINADVLLRQPLARWEPQVKKGKVAVSLEEPRVSATGGQGRGRFWDGLGRYSHEGDLSSFYVAALVRQLGVTPTTDPDSPPADELTAFGWGITGGFNRSLRRLGPNDGFQMTATVGQGVARYINDLNAAGGLDAYVDPQTGQLETGLSTALLTSYRHFWNFQWRSFRTLRSTFTLGLVHMSYPTDVADDTTLRQTVRTSVNVLWSPLQGVDLGLEYLWGRRENVDGQAGSASQVQFATFYRF